MTILSDVDGVPGVNDLVRVTLGGLDDPDATPLASAVPSRVEDLVQKGENLPTHYLIAAPWFSGDLETPGEDAECSLQWTTPRGLCLLPVSFCAQEVTAAGLRVWRLRVTGPPRREERRRYVRVQWRLDARMDVRRDFDALPPEQRRLVELGGLRNLVDELPGTFDSESLNVSEGGLLCTSPALVLPQHLPLVVSFTLSEVRFEVPAHIVWSVTHKHGGAPVAVSAVEFDDQGRLGEHLRPFLFQAQLRARRARLA